MKFYMIVKIVEQKQDEEKIVAIFTNKNLAECYMDDSPNIMNYRLIELKGE